MNEELFLIPFCFQTMSRKTRRRARSVFEYVSTLSLKPDALIGRKRIGINSILNTPRLKRRLLNITVVLLPLTFLLGIIISQTRLQECVTGSLKGVRYILVVKNLSFKRGDIVSIQGHDTAYAKDMILAKRLIGLPGDVIVRDKEGVKVLPALVSSTNSRIKTPQTQVFSLLEKTKEGKPLTPPTTVLIPQGYVFVAGDHPRSFDSRYEEFGLVHMGNIIGRALWWW